MTRYNVDTKHVRLRLHKKLIPKFLSQVPKGFDVTIYPVDKKQKKQYYDQNIRNVTFNVTERFSDPKFRKYKNDIDEFLAGLNKIDPRIKLLNDKVTTNDQTNLMKKPYIAIETLIDKPGMMDDPIMDKYASKAKNIRDIDIKASNLAAIHKQYEDMKKDYIRTKFSKDDVKDTGRIDEATGEKIYSVRQGEI